MPAARVDSANSVKSVESPDSAVSTIGAHAPPRAPAAITPRRDARPRAHVRRRRHAADARAREGAAGRPPSALPAGGPAKPPARRTRCASPERSPERAARSGISANTRHRPAAPDTDRPGPAAHEAVPNGSSRTGRSGPVVPAVDPASNRNALRPSAPRRPRPSPALHPLAPARYVAVRTDVTRTSVLRNTLQTVSDCYIRGATAHRRPHPENALNSWH